MIEELISRVFASRNAAHIEHWRTDSFARHSALGDFYDVVIDKIDSLVEAYQGAFDLVKVGTLDRQPPAGDIIKHLEDDMEWISKNRIMICKGLPSLDNILQDLEGLYLSTLYKLKRLK